ncbi:MAG: RNA polymerase subunit sigma [Bacteroidetes bacterium CG18_big_fil_WC_8_21_14_2_50_41_14]|nr:MAG: RNA polymerase subunit sigma [Bacteroidetes bacterium CG18_big_fil_WC_8_21_14_2_50_41_14]PJB56086.1 MAG: RNA polymerase subunit sigma [Bacteroidetes bacterium CG_4_9_14_3_um_filter_41_19]
MENENLKKWVNEFTNELYKWAYYKTSSTEASEDLVQETFLAAAEKLNTFKGDSSPKTWLFSILNHKIIDYYRKNVNKPVAIESISISTYFDEDGGWQQEKRPKDWQDKENQLLDNDDFQQILQKCLDALPEKWNTCVKLKYFTEKSGEDICQELGITSTNFWQIGHRAKLQLRNCIENNWFKN